MTALAAPVDDVPTCRNDHRMVGRNVIYEPGGNDRKVRARCRQCKRDSVARWRARQTLDGVRVAQTKILVPRTNRHGAEVVDRAYATAKLLALVPKELRDRLARLLLDDHSDPLQRAVLRRCAEQRAWAAMHEDAAARVFVEAVIAQTIDARSPSLRIDRVLAALLT